LVGLWGSAVAIQGLSVLTVNGRNDWSSTLPEANRSFFYPAVSAAFVFTDALNMNSSILNSGKIRRATPVLVMMQVLIC
jgi:hypothetical protein